MRVCERESPRVRGGRLSCGGGDVKASQHKLFMQQFIQAGIKGRAVDRRLVLQHFAAVVARKQVQEQLRLKKAAEAGTTDFSWDEEKERVLQELKAAAKAASQAARPQPRK